MLGASKLIDIFTEYTTSDISDTETMLEVLKLFIASRNAEINEVHFPAELGPSYVYATRRTAIEGAVDQFLGIEASGGPRGTIERAPKNERQEEEEEDRQEEGEEAAGEAEAAAANDGLVDCGAKPAKTRRRPWPARSAATSRSYYPTRLPSGAAYEESNPYLEDRRPARLPLQGHRR